MSAAAQIMIGIGPQKYARNMSSGLTFFSGNSFRPYSPKRCAT